MPRKVVPIAPPVVIVRKKAVRPTAAPVQAQPTPGPSPASIKAKAAPPPALTAKPVRPTTQPKTPPAPQPVPRPQAAPSPVSAPVPASAPPPTPAVETAPTGPSKKELEKQARRALLEVFRTRWPLAFPRDFRQVRPFALGIHKDIAALLPEQPPQRIRAVIPVFQMLTGAGYYLAVLRGGPRYDLEGNPRGEVTAEEQEIAKRDLAAFYARRKARQQAQRKAEAQPPASPAPPPKV
jgi:ProQ/FINO family